MDFGRPLRCGLVSNHPGQDNLMMAGVLRILTGPKNLKHDGQVQSGRSCDRVQPVKCTILMSTGHVVNFIFNMYNVHTIGCFIIALLQKKNKGIAVRTPPGCI